MKNFLLDTKNSYKVKIATKDDSNEITKLEEIIFSDDSNSVSFINEIKYENKYHILLVRKIFERKKTHKYNMLECKCFFYYCMV